MSTGLSLLVGMSSIGCVDNESSMTVESVLSPVAPACNFVADPGAAQLLRGTLDVAFRYTYNATLLVGNQLTPRGDKKQLRTETQGINLEGAEVRLTDSRGRLLDEYSVNVGGFVSPNDSENPGYGLARVALIPPSRGEDLLDDLSEKGRGSGTTVIANVRVFGSTLGGVEVTSSEFTFPIDVCYGCLVVFPLEAVRTDVSPALCTNENAEFAGDDSCTLGQDEYIDCRTCAATLDVCAQVVE